MISSNIRKLVLCLFYFLSIIIVLTTYKDYGIHIEEKFHRLNGLYWLNYISSIFDFSLIQEITKNKIKDISDYTLSSVTHYNKYGVLFDVPTALIEILFKINDVKEVYYLKHLLSFFLFLFSSLVFYLILQKRFNNFIFSFTGLILYVTTPRILGDSFLYKDVLFLSFFSFAFYFLIKSINELNYKNLLIFAVFSSLCLNLRPFAIFIPFFFTFIITLKSFNLKNFKENSKKIIFYFFCYFFSLYIFWPYLWADPLNNFVEMFLSVKANLVDVKILYNGNFISNRMVPDFYTLKWIFISTPVLQSTFFLLGYLFCFFRIIRRFLGIKENTIHHDLWRGDKEQIDFTFFIFLSLFYFFIILFNAPLYNGWRLLYFLNIFLIYFSINFLFNLKSFFKRKKIDNFIILLILLLISFNIYGVIKTHPYQSLYYNSLISEKTKSNYEGDYHGLSMKHFFEELIKRDNRQLIKVAVASHTPVQRGLESIDIEYRKKFQVVGQEYHQAEYIFKNNISEVNSNLIKKYQIPSNFKKIFELNIDKSVIYEAYKIN